MKLIPLLMIIAGVVLLYASYSDQDPRAVLFGAIGSKAKVKSKGAKVKPASNSVPDTGLPPQLDPGSGPVVSV